MGGFAWVTLATNDSYSLGALVLAHSLRRVGTKHDLAVLVTPGVTGAMREKLSTVFSLVQEVNVLDSKDEANLALLARPELGITFTKLHCWRLTQYEKCVFVDADTLVIRNCDELFERDELSASPDVGWPDCFNSGVFVFKPSQQTFASITSFAAAKGSFDGGDQGLLNQYFSDWAHKDISKHLPFIYNMCSTATYSYLPAFKQFGEDVRIIHFIGVTKPWLQYFDTLTGQVQPAPGTNHLQPLLQLWWNIFCENVHPQLSPVMASNTLAQLWHEFDPYPSFPKDSPTFPHDFNDSKYENIEPDFSEFQDPWDFYVEESNVPDLALNESNNSHNNNNNSNNDNRQYIRKNDSTHSLPSRDDFSHQPSASFKFTHHEQFRMENYHSDMAHRDEYKVSSMLENTQHKETQDNSQIIHDQAIKHLHGTRENDHFTNFHISEKNDHFFNKPERNDHSNNSNKTEVHFKHFEKPKTNDHSNHSNKLETYHQMQNINRTCDSNHERDNDNERYYEQNKCEYTEKEKEAHDHSNEKIHRQNDENFHHNEDHHHHHHHHNHREIDNSMKKNSKFETNRQNDEDRLNDQCRVDCHEEQTDVCNTVSHSHPAPCTKSKSVTTQSEPNIARQLKINDAGIAGALAKITLGEARSPDQVAFEEHMRKQSWEQGQIDYMGRDSFDNIWKKISETLAEQPEREPSPPKTVPKPETSKIKEATPDTTEDEPATKSEAAVLAEPRRKEEEDLIGELAPDVKNIISPLPEVTPEQVSGETVSSQSTGSDAAVTTAALVSTIPQLSKLESLELIKSKNDDVTSILPTSTITTDSSAPETPKSITDDLKLDEQSQKTHPEIPSSIIPEVEKSLESSKDVKNEPIRLTEIASAEILSEGHVPIQVAESVLEADIKESVTEDLRPVTEEVISSISATAQESVPAVVETAMEAVTPEIPTPNGSANLSSEIGNGIDGLNISSPIRASVADVPPEVVDLVKTEELFKAPTVLSAQTTPEALISAEKEESLSSSMPIEELQESKVSAETESEISPVKVAEISQEAKLPEVGQDSPVELVEKAQEFESSTETQEISPISIGLTEKGQETVELSSPPLVEPSEKSEVQTSMEVQEIKLAPVEVSEKLQETTSLTKPQEISAPSVELTGQPPEEPKPSTEAPTSVEPPEKSQISSASTEPSEKPQETKVSAETIQPSSPPLVEADSKPEETKVPAETIQPSSPPLVEADSKPEETKVPGETIQPSSSPLVEADSKPQETKVPAETIQPSSPPLVEADSKPQETELPTESEKSSVSSPKAEEKAESAKSVTKEQETISCPIKPARKIELPELSLKTELPLEKKVPKDEAIEIELTEEIASQSESSEESPTRPARTKDIQIPDTPTITEATPPTSPPIGGAESLDTQQTTKVGKKVVKKVVKKTTSTESKPVEGAETEDGKKVTKKIVKKVVKKKDDEGNGEATSSSEKPKKIVKVVKKTTKTSQTLESDTTVPETPPPDAPEVPVPPKRKLKTTTKTTTAKSDSEP